MEHASEGKPKKPVLLVAAESIAVASGMCETVADVLRARALKHYTEALRQYLSVRLSNTLLADQAMIDVRRELENWSSDELAGGPGPRAHLFKLARKIAKELGASTGNTTSGQLLWLGPNDRAPQGYASALARVRKDLPAADAELLELRYARELSPEEVAHVVDRPIDDVVSELTRAASRAAGILGQSPPSRLGGLRGALQEAFALSPSAAASERSTPRGQGLPSGTLIGERYAIQHRVGEGSFGDVYRALDMDVPGHVVALKILHRESPSEDARKAALRELRLIASVFHPSVVDFKDHGWYRERLWFVMPWYEGETLEDRINREPLTRQEAQEIFVPLAQALATMHASGIRHQDVKPDNIFLARIGEGGEASGGRILPVLIDLGVAAKEAEMIVAGTPLYFPPEIAAQYAEKTERPPVTPTADVFSLALSLRNALEPSTQEQVPGTAIEAFISFRADTPPTGPTGAALRFLEPSFKRWLAKDARLRPTAQEFARDLRVLTSPEEKRERRRTVLSWALPIAVCALAGISSMSYVYMLERDRAAAARLRADQTQDQLGIVSAQSEELKESYELSELTRQELETKLDGKSKRAKRLAQLLIRSRRDGEATNARLRTTTQELEGVRRDVEQAQRRMDTQNARIASLEGDLFSTKERKALVDSELREARSRLSSAEQELQGLRTRAHTMLAELDRARQKINGSKDRLAALESELSAVRQQETRAHRELVLARQRNAELMQRVRELEASRPAPKPNDVL